MGLSNRNVLGVAFCFLAVAAAFCVISGSIKWGKVTELGPTSEDGKSDPAANKSNKSTKPSEKKEDTASKYDSGENVDTGSDTDEYKKVDPIYTTPEIHNAPKTTKQRLEHSSSPRLFALLIGINTYNELEGSSLDRPQAHTADSPPIFHNLRGALSDAEKFGKYLIQDLKVPEDHITFLRDKNAKRANIIDAFENLANDERIAEGDAIFIFYAGHGAQAYPPLRMISTDGCPNMIEILIPHDYSKVSSNHENMGIPDYTLAALINEIAAKKGDNITIVFDCCHAASALRGSPDSQTIIRSGPKLTYHMPDELDRDIWDVTSASTRALTTYNTSLKHYGTTSYVFFSACASFETAREVLNQGGCFTKALLDLLKEHGSNTLTCTEIVERLPTITGQSPQCEGIHRSRPIFHSYVPPNSKRFFDVYKKLPQFDKDTTYDFTIREGQTHGLSRYDELTIYTGKTKEGQDNPVGTAFIVDFDDADSTTKLKANPPTFLLPCNPAPALFTKSTEVHLKLYVDTLNDDDLHFRVRNLIENNQVSNVVLTMDPTAAHIGVSTDRTTGQLRFDVNDNHLVRKGVKLRPRFIPSDADKDLLHVLKGLAHYYWHLKRTGNSLSLDGISVSFLRVRDRFSDQAPRFVALEDSPGLCDHASRWIDIEVGQVDETSGKPMYGFKLTNATGKKGLYPVLLYFDNLDFTIVPIFMLPIGPSPEPPWDAGSSMTIGYGLGPGSTVAPLSFVMTEGCDTEAGFFKLFLSNKPIDLDGVLQESSPFLMLRGLKQEYPAVLSQTSHQWAEMTFTVVTRRKQITVSKSVSLLSKYFGCCVSK